MSHTLLEILDYFFLAFHAVLTIFILIGWVWKRTRKWHFLVLLLTLSSWFVAGIWMGFGYCFFTDWHWQIREQLGNPIIQDSYIQFLLKEVFNLKIKSSALDNTVMLMFFISFLLTTYLNVSDRRFYRKFVKNQNSSKAKEE